MRGKETENTQFNHHSLTNQCDLMHEHWTYEEDNEKMWICGWESLTLGLTSISNREQCITCSNVKNLVTHRHIKTVVPQFFSRRFRVFSVCSFTWRDFFLLLLNVQPKKRTKKREWHVEERRRGKKTKEINRWTFSW